MALSQAGRFTFENDRAEAAAAARAEPVSVADQRAQGIAPEDTVTMADQRAAAAAAEVPEAPAKPQPKKPPAPLGAAK